MLAIRCCARFTSLDLGLIPVFRAMMALTSTPWGEVLYVHVWLGSHRFRRLAPLAHLPTLHVFELYLYSEIPFMFFSPLLVNNLALVFVLTAS